MFDKKTIIHFAVTTAIVIVGVVVANNYIQPMINKSKVTPPATA